MSSLDDDITRALNRSAGPRLEALLPAKEPQMEPNLHADQDPKDAAVELVLKVATATIAICVIGFLVKVKNELDMTKAYVRQAVALEALASRTEGWTAPRLGTDRALLLAGSGDLLPIYCTEQIDGKVLCSTQLFKEKTGAN